MCLEGAEQIGSVEALLLREMRTDSEVGRACFSSVWCDPDGRVGWITFSVFPALPPLESPGNKPPALLALPSSQLVFVCPVSSRASGAGSSAGDGLQKKEKKPLLCDTVERAFDVRAFGMKE